MLEIDSNHYQLSGLRESSTNNSERGSDFMIEATNPSGSPQPLTITFADHAPKHHPYYYYRTPQGTWYRKHFDIDPRSFSLQLEPGVTRIASVPYFTYQEYLDYVQSLTDSRITKELAFTDEDGAFKVYRLKVTNPNGVKDKLKICFAKATHTNETSGYFMAHGIIDWLLSGDPAANLDNTEWTIYLCPDPKAVYNHYQYREIEYELYDGGRNGLETFYRDIGDGHHHIISIQHMWNNEHADLDLENYSYGDPFEKRWERIDYPDDEPSSPVYRAYQAYMPYWFEYGTNRYHVCNYCYKWPPYALYLGECHPRSRGEPEGEWEIKELENGWLLETLGGGWLFYNEIFYYGKDADGDLIANLREQGKQWARATGQVYLRFQQEHGYWTSSHKCGAVDLTGATLLPIPQHLLLEKLTPTSGSGIARQNGNKEAMNIFHKKYDHGWGMKAGDQLVFRIPEGVNSFKANVAVDDAEPAEGGTARFGVKLDGRDVWRSRWLKKYESQMAHVAIRGAGEFSLVVEGSPGTLGDWGGARLTIHDPDKEDNE
ncbi:MAG: hypothetical protein A2Y76_09790 [Planctomycetes bacterium RBG_13_60_9]|nr:MAG: hypothetical protein A2Y76_09790 [Planctomycetes bacterium RBG_13_60_9]